MRQRLPGKFEGHHRMMNVHQKDKTDMNVFQRILNVYQRILSMDAKKWHLMLEEISVFLCYVLTVQSTSNTSSLYILLHWHKGLQYTYGCCGFPCYIMVTQGCTDYNTIIEAVEPTYRSLEEHSEESIVGVWLNRSYIDVWTCEPKFNSSKLCEYIPCI